MKKLFVVSLLLVAFHSNANAFFLDLITGGVSAVANAAKQAKDELFEDTMIKNTIDSLGVLKKNYDEATAAYAEAKQAQQNPGKILDDAMDTFKQGFGNPEQEVQDKINESSQKQKGILGTLHDEAKVKELAWIDENITIAEWMKDKVQKHNESLLKASDMLKSNDKDTVESGKNLCLLLSTYALINQERMTADLMKMFSEQAKKDYSTNLDLMLVEKNMVGAMQNIYSSQSYYVNDGDRKQNLLNKIGEIPTKPHLSGASQ